MSEPDMQQMVADCVRLILFKHAARQPIKCPPPPPPNSFNLDNHHSPLATFPPHARAAIVRPCQLP